MEINLIGRSALLHILSIVVLSLLLLIKMIGFGVAIAILSFYTMLRLYYIREGIKEGETMAKEKRVKSAKAFQAYQERRGLAASAEPETEVMETVTLISSGYEWECPKCEFFNMEYEANLNVKCDSCGKEFMTSLQHAER